MPSSITGTIAAPKTRKVAALKPSADRLDHLGRLLFLG